MTLLDTVRLYKRALKTAMELELDWTGGLKNPEERKALLKKKYDEVQRLEAQVADYQRKGQQPPPEMQRTLGEYKKALDQLLAKQGMKVEGASWAALEKMAAAKKKKPPTKAPTPKPKADVALPPGGDDHQYTAGAYAPGKGSAMWNFSETGELDIPEVLEEIDSWIAIETKEENKDSTNPEDLKNMQDFKDWVLSQKTEDERRDYYQERNPNQLKMFAGKRSKKAAINDAQVTDLVAKVNEMDKGWSEFKAAFNIGTTGAQVGDAFNKISETVKSLQELAKAFQSSGASEGTVSGTMVGVQTAGKKTAHDQLDMFHGDEALGEEADDSYCPCACRDCVEVATVGAESPLCMDCQASGCTGEGKCESPFAYGMAQEMDESEMDSHLDRMQKVRLDRDEQREKADKGE